MENQNKHEEMRMTYSSVMRKGKEKVVHIRFEREVDGKTEFAEGILPECLIEKSIGFTLEECKALEFYMKENCESIFEQAQKINDDVFWLR